MIYLYRKTGRKLSRVPRFLLVPRLLSLFFPLFFLSLSFNFAVPPLAVPWIVYRMHTYIERFSSWDYEYFYVDECLIVLLFGENGLGRKGIFEKHSLLLELSSKRREKKCIFFDMENCIRPTFLLDPREKEGWSLNTYHFERILRMWTTLSHDLQAYSDRESKLYIYIFSPLNIFNNM